jgi:hypothetical protein
MSQITITGLPTQTSVLDTTFFPAETANVTQKISGLSLKNYFGSISSLNITSGTFNTITVTSGATVGALAVGADAVIGGNVNAYNVSASNNLSGVNITASGGFYGTILTTSQPNIIGVGNVTVGTWSANIGAVNGSKITNLNAAQLSGIVPAAVLAQSTVYIGTTGIALNRQSAQLTLTGVSIDGIAASATKLQTARNINGVVFDGTQDITISVGGGVSGSLLPTANLTYNLGNSSYWFGTGYIGSVVANTVQSGSVTPSANLTYNLGSTTNWWSTVYAQNITAQGTINVGSVNSNIVPSANLTYSLGDSTHWWNNIYGTAVHALYADLAEKYLADADYPAGTVMVVGGSAEVTACQPGMRAIGAISANPAVKMNAGLVDGVYVALKGRIPVSVLGIVNKGTELTTGPNGAAVAARNGDRVFAVALENTPDAGLNLIEAIIL